MFSKKDIRVTFQLGAGSFSAGGNTKIVSGLACSFNIEQVAAPDFCKAQGKIYNMNIDDYTYSVNDKEITFEEFLEEYKKLFRTDIAFIRAKER